MISVLKVEFYVGFVFSIFDFFINKIYQANDRSEFYMQ